MTSLMSMSNEFVIWGPSVTSENVVLNAIHALYYLPQQYRLILPKATPAEKTSYERVLSLIQRDQLGERVTFSDKQIEAAYQAVIVAKEADALPGYIFGNTPESLASAILDAARAVE